MLIPDFYNYTAVMYIVSEETEWRLYENSVNYFWNFLHYFQRKSWKKNPLVPTLCVCVHTHARTQIMTRTKLSGILLTERMQSHILTYCISSSRFLRPWQVYQHNTSNATGIIGLLMSKTINSWERANNKDKNYLQVI